MTLTEDCRLHMKCCYNCMNDTLEPPEVIGNGICEHSKIEINGS